MIAKDNNKTSEAGHSITKICKNCNQIKSLSEFSIRKDTKNYRNECKICRNLKQKNYSKTETAKIVQYNADQKRNKKFPKRRRARSLLYKAIKNKKIIPLPCLICGEKSEAHHVAYDMPLDVVWLCKLHHKQAHEITKGDLN